jgi:hypothetical protein
VFGIGFVLAAGLAGEPRPRRRGRRNSSTTRTVSRIDPSVSATYRPVMHAVEFTANLGPERTLVIPEEIACQLPKSGKARVIVLTADDPDNTSWRSAAYKQFMLQDAPEDKVYGTWQ